LPSPLLVPLLLLRRSFFSTPPATPDLYTLSLHDALPIYSGAAREQAVRPPTASQAGAGPRAALWTSRTARSAPPGPPGGPPQAGPPRAQACPAAAAGCSAGTARSGPGRGPAWPAAAPARR